MTRFLPGAAAFVAAILVALVGLYANAAVAAAAGIARTRAAA